MKRFVASMLMVLVLISLLSVIAFAEHYEFSYTKTNFDVGYVYPDPKITNVAVRCYYQSGGILGIIPAKANTTLSIADDAWGTSYATLTATSNEYATSSNDTIVNGKIDSGYAIVTGAARAKRVSHYAYRNSNIVEDWIYNFS